MTSSRSHLEGRDALEDEFRGARHVATVVGFAPLDYEVAAGQRDETFAVVAVREHARDRGRARARAARERRARPALPAAERIRSRSNSTASANSRTRSSRRKRKKRKKDPAFEARRGKLARAF